MARYSDLSHYEYTSDSVPAGVEAFNVGWLEAGDEFPTGETSGEFVDALGELCRDDPQMKMRGWHRCQLEHEGETPYPVVVHVGEHRLSLGGAEVRVVAGDGSWLIAPDLVLHYVTEHRYLPPPSFVEAVTARRWPGRPLSGRPGRRKGAHTT